MPSVLAIVSKTVFDDRDAPRRITPPDETLLRELGGASAAVAAYRGGVSSTAAEARAREPMAPKKREGNK